MPLGVVLDKGAAGAARAGVEVVADGGMESLPLASPAGSTLVCGEDRHISLPPRLRRSVRTWRM